MNKIIEMSGNLIKWEENQWSLVNKIIKCEEYCSWEGACNFSMYQLRMITKKGSNQITSAIYHRLKTINLSGISIVGSFYVKSSRDLKLDVSDLNYFCI